MPADGKSRGMHLHIFRPGRHCTRHCQRYAGDGAKRHGCIGDSRPTAVHCKWNQCKRHCIFLRICYAFGVYVRPFYLYQQVAAVQAGLTQTNENVSSLDSELTALQGTVTGNKSELDGEISSLQNTVTSNKNELDGEIESLQGALNTHTGNTEIHVTQADKNKWNASIAPDDYVIEEGTSGIWRYRKWESGLAECWGNSSQTIDINNTWDAAGNLVYGTGEPVLYPFTFTEVPSCMITQQNYDGLVILAIRASGTTTQTPTPGLVKIAPTNDGYEMIFAFEAKGKYR